MRKPTFVCDCELSAPFDERSDLDRFGDARVLLRLHGRPLGHTRVPIVSGRVDLESLERRIVRDFSSRFASLLAERAITTGVLPSRLDPESLLVPPSNGRASAPTVTVAVCTRNRTDDLARCLAALDRANYPNLDILVIDNAPDTDETASFVRDGFLPSATYARFAQGSIGLVIAPFSNAAATSSRSRTTTRSSMAVGWPHWHGSSR